VLSSPCREHEAQWLSPEARSAEELLPLLLTPYPAELMRSYAVSKKMNRAGTEGVDLITPLTGRALNAGGGGDVSPRALSL
jgi:putative SOS response-associated peptidase YedK